MLQQVNIARDYVPAGMVHAPSPCIRHDVAWCAPLIGYANSPCSFPRDAVATGGSPPAASDNATIFPLAFMLGAS